MSLWALIGYAMAGVSLLLQAVLWWRVYSRVATWKKEDHQGQNDAIPVSVIVCARNEAANLQKNLPRFLNQTYRLRELLIVNDNSSDQTAQILLAAQHTCQTFTPVNAPPRPPGWHGKKWALQHGIGQARYEVLLLTDADGEPGPEWIASMMRPLQGKKEAVLGYAPYHPDDTWLNRLIRYETAWTAIQYLGWALAGHPYMGVGRNVAYRKNLFDQAGGMQQHAHLASGDDDLLLGQVLRRENTAIQLDPASWVYSTAAATWRDFLRQKRRHLSTSWHYAGAVKFRLGLHAASLLLFYPGVALCGGPWWVIIALLLGRWAGLRWQMGRALQRLGERDLILRIPQLDLLHYGYLVMMTAFMLNQKPVQWK
jgi:glycosyltransferase involved in cell wall biosynthesis